jgi:hypothetical protein
VPTTTRDARGAGLAAALGKQHYRGHAFGWIALLLIGAALIVKSSGPC